MLRFFWARHPALKWIPMCLWPTSFEVRSLRSPRQGATSATSSNWGGSGDTFNLEVTQETCAGAKPWNMIGTIATAPARLSSISIPKSILSETPSSSQLHRYMVADDSENCQPAFMKLDLKKQLLGWCWGPKEAYGIQAALRYGPAMILGEAGAWGWSDGIFESSSI